MPFSLYRISDKAGDSGPMSRRIWPDRREDKENTPIVGAAICVGSIYARTYQAQDWWQTTLVTEIVSDDVDDYTGERTIVFKTSSNSTYIWKHF